MNPQPPFLLVDNVFDRINLYPGATLYSVGDAYGTDMRYVADYRRERTMWKSAVAQASNYIGSDLGAGGDTVVDTIVLDRGHNLWGKTVQVKGDDGAGGSLATLVTRALPALGTVGGDPTVAWCITEEGAAYTFLPSTTRRRFAVYVVDDMQPIITGIILGARVQLTGYSKTRDEDAGRRQQRSDESAAGYVASDRVYAGRTLSLELGQIGSATYDAQIRTLRRLLFERNQPAFIAVDYGAYPERAWLYRLDQETWSAPMQRVQRETTLTFRELYPAIR